MWPQAHAHHMAAPPGSVESNPVDTPGCDGLSSRHRAALCSLPAQDTMGPLVGAAICPSPRPPRGSPRDLELQLRGQTCWATPPSTSIGCSLGLNRESCVSSLAPRPGRYLFCQDQHRWARQRIPVPERRQTREHFLSLTILLPSALLELIQFTTGSCGAQQWRS